MKKQLKNLQDTQYIAAGFSQILSAGEVLCLYGQMGSGKTTFARFLIQSFYQRYNMPLCNVSSPTFAIIQEYPFKDFTIAHFDLFRVENLYECEEIGLDDYLNDPNILCIIEWPEHAIDFLPKDRVECFFTFLTDKRELVLNLCGRCSTQKENYINCLQTDKE